MDQYLVFSGEIDQEAANRFTQAVTFLSAPQNQGWHCHIAIQSNGGQVAHGLFIYELLRTASFRWTSYNIGVVGSVASVIFLAAKNRKCSASAVFHIHQVRADAQAATASTLRVMAERVAADDSRTSPILRSNLSLSEDQWILFDSGRDVMFDAAGALECGFVDGFVEWAPTGTLLRI